MDDFDWVMSAVWRFWGKTSNKNDNRWHSVLCHCIDAGVVAKAILSKDWYLKQSLCLVFEMPEKEILNFIPFVVALHDLGKISDCFQRESGVSKWMYDWIDLKKFPKWGFKKERHEKISRHVLMEDSKGSPQLLKKYIDGELENIYEIGMAFSLHHGKFHGLPLSRNGKSTLCSGFVAGEWIKVQEQFAELLFNLFRPSRCKFHLGKIKQKTRAWTLVTGLLIESDWVSSQYSNPEFTQDASGKIDPLEYMKRSEANVIKVLGEQLLHEIPARSNTPNYKATFKETFPKINFQPNGLQQLVQNMVLDGRIDTSKQFLVFINSPMGGGKTEAAIYLSELAGKGEVFLLPSQATCNSIYDRRVEYADALPGKSVIELSHSLRTLSKEHKKILERHWKRLVNPEENGTVTTAFFGNAKKALLARYCVATLDQIAMAAIKSKHMFLRWYAVAGKTVIIDEVHSFGIYTQEFIKETIRWLKAMKCNVIIVSATMTSTHKKELIECWDAKLSDEQARVYPVLIVCQDDKPIVEKIPYQSIKVKVEIVKSFDEGLERLSSLIRTKNATATIFRNVVSETQDAYARTKAKFNLADEEVICLHAKMPAFQCEQTEKQLLGRMDSSNAPKRNGRMVAVASQKCEQSLNFDSDCGMTDSCVMDSILQRIGRTHRFLLAWRPEGFEEPILIVVDTSENDPPFGKSANIYDPYLLRKTMQILKTTPVISIPEDVQWMMDETYAGIDPNNIRPSQDGDLSVEESFGERNRCIANMNAECIAAKGISIGPCTPCGLGGFIDMSDEDIENTVRKVLPSKKIIVVFKDGDGKLYADWDFKEPIDISFEKKDREQSFGIPPEWMKRIKRLMSNSVSIHVYHFLKCAEWANKPLIDGKYPSWEKVPFLDRCFPEIFSNDGNGGFINGYGMKLSKKTGLSFAQ